MSALDNYFEANELGIIAENSPEALNALNAQKEASENKIQNLTDAINISNSKIAGWRTAKATAGKGYRKTLSAYIAAEQGKINSYRAQLSAQKATLSEINKSISRINSYKSASFYINQGVNSTVSSLKASIKSEQNSFSSWYEDNGQSASFAEIAKQSAESLTKQLCLQKSIIGEVGAALEKTNEIYGENSKESVELTQLLTKETLAYKNLESSAVSAASTIIKSTQERINANKTEIENEKNLNIIRQETQKGTISKAKEQEETTASLIKQLTVQGKIVYDIAEAYKESVKMSGASCEASKKLESQLIKEAAAYEVIRGNIKELQETTGYTREAKYKIAYTMNDYIKDNYDLLKGYGYSDEEIYSIARRVSGYDELVEFNKGSKNSSLASSAEIIDGVVEHTVTNVFNTAASLDDIIKNLTENAKNGITISPIMDPALLTSASNQTYNSVYNLNAGSSATVAQQIEEIKKFDSLKKARGIN